MTSLIWPAVAARLRAFEALYTDTAVPVDWRFTRAKLEERLAHLTPVSVTALAIVEPFQQRVA